MELYNRLKQIEGELYLQKEICVNYQTMQSVGLLNAEKRGILLARSSTLKEVLELINKMNDGKTKGYINREILKSKITALETEKQQ